MRATIGQRLVAEWARDRKERKDQEATLFLFRSAAACTLCCPQVLHSVRAMLALPQRDPSTAEPTREEAATKALRSRLEEGQAAGELAAAGPDQE